MLGYVGLSVPKVNPDAFLAYYRLLEEAGHRELLASAHGLYRGGLAVHLVLCQPGGGAGAGGGPEPGGARNPRLTPVSTPNRPGVSW